MSEAANVGHNSGEFDSSLLQSLDEIPTDQKLARVRDLAKLQRQREKIVANFEVMLAGAKRELAEVANRDLPVLLTDLNIKKLPLANGATIEVKTNLVANVKKEDRTAFYDWMHKHGFGSLVKREVTVEFGRGDFKKAGKLLGYIHRWYKDFRHADDESIHGGTLKAWARELKEKNDAALTSGGKILEFPETLTVTELLESVITEPKDKKIDWS